MKALVIIASALFAFTASAGEFSKPENVTFQSASAWVAAKDVCRDGDFLKHKRNATIEVEYCNDHHSNCKIVSKPLIQPVVSTVTTCAKETGKDGSKCVRPYTYTLDQSSVKVWFYHNEKDMAGGDRGWTDGTRYVIPACAGGGGTAD